MGYDYHGHAFVGQLLYYLFNFTNKFRVQCRSWLIKIHN